MVNLVSTLKKSKLRRSESRSIRKVSLSPRIRSMVLAMASMSSTSIIKVETRTIEFEEGDTTCLRSVVDVAYL